MTQGPQGTQGQAVAPDDPRVRRALDVKRGNIGRLRAYPHVTGVGVGFKEVAGSRTDQVAVRVYVDRKLPRAQLSAEEVLPEEIDGVPVDVIEATFQVHGSPTPAEHRRRHAPMLGGTSVAFRAVGTALVQLRADPEMRGRAMSLLIVAVTAPTPVGGPLRGWGGAACGPASSPGPACSSSGTTASRGSPAGVDSNDGLFAVKKKNLVLAGDLIQRALTEKGLISKRRPQDRKLQEFFPTSGIRAFTKLLYVTVRRMSGRPSGGR